MDVNMDSMRIQLVNAYSSLCKTLNKSVDGTFTDYLDVKIEDIQKDMDELRELIGGLCCVYSDKEKMFNMIRNEVGDIPWFNETKNE